MAVESEIEEKDSRIEDLENQLEEKDSRIEDLENQLEEATNSLTTEEAAGALLRHYYGHEPSQGEVLALKEHLEGVLVAQYGISAGLFE